AEARWLVRAPEGEAVRDQGDDRPQTGGEGASDVSPGGFQRRRHHRPRRVLRRTRGQVPPHDAGGGFPRGAGLDRAAAAPAGGSGPPGHRRHRRRRPLRRRLLQSGRARLRRDRPEVRPMIHTLAAPVAMPVAFVSFAVAASMAAAPMAAAPVAMGKLALPEPGQQILLVDIDGDGNEEPIVVYGGKAGCLLGRITGSGGALRLEPLLPEGGPRIVAPVVGDADGDGTPDLLSVDADGVL